MTTYNRKYFKLFHIRVSNESSYESTPKTYMNIHARAVRLAITLLESEFKFFLTIPMFDSLPF